jgi:hypothetical protein
MDCIATAQACRTLLLWVSHDTYPNEAMPPIRYIFKERLLSELVADVEYYTEVV